MPKDKSTPADALRRALEDLVQTTTAAQGAKTPEFYMQMTAWTLQAARKAAVTYRAFPALEAGSLERSRAADALDVVAGAIEALIKGFANPTVTNDRVMSLKSAVEDHLKAAGKEMTRAMASTTGYAVSEEDLSDEEARARVLKALEDAKTTDAEP